MGRRPPYSMKSATPPASRVSGSRGNRRTRGGPGRHNLGRAGPNRPVAKIRICLNCNRPFKSRGPWNRFCGRCHAVEDEHDNTKAYHIPKEWPPGVFGEDF